MNNVNLKGIIEKNKDMYNCFIFTKHPIYTHSYEALNFNPYFRAHIKDVDNNGVLIQSYYDQEDPFNAWSEDIYIPFSNIIQITFSEDEDLVHMSH